MHPVYRDAILLTRHHVEVDGARGIKDGGEFTGRSDWRAWSVIVAGDRDERVQTGAGVNSQQCGVVASRRIEVGPSRRWCNPAIPDWRAAADARMNGLPSLLRSPGNIPN